MLIAMLMTVVGASAYRNTNIKVWGEVDLADDGQYYLTMYKNCPATVVAHFHFKYRGGGTSQDYDLFMADSVAVLHDPVPVDRAVRKVVVEDVFYSTPDGKGGVYKTDDPNDPILEIFMVDLFDLHHDIFWFDGPYRASYYDRWSYEGPEPLSVNRIVNREKQADDIDLPESLSVNRIANREKQDDDIDLTKLDEKYLLLGIAAVTGLGVVMGIGVSRNWDVPDNRYPYFSFSPQVQYFFDSGMVRDVMQFKYRFGNRGGWSLFGDIGATTGTLEVPEVFDSGFTWSIGAGLDLGDFSMTLSGKPAIYDHVNNFLAFQLGYDIPITRHFGIDLHGGACLLSYMDEYYLDFPLSLGLIWRY